MRVRVCLGQSVQNVIRLTLKYQGPGKLKEDELRAVFSTVDLDHNGFISKSELKNMMVTLGESIKDQEVNDMIEKADSNGDGQINIEEFIKLMTEN